MCANYQAGVTSEDTERLNTIANRGMRLLFEGLSQLPRRTKRLVMALSDVVLVPFALWSAFALQDSHLIPSTLQAGHWWLFPLAIMFTVPVLAGLGLYREIVRFMGSQLVFEVVKGVSVSALVIFGSAKLLAPELPASVFLIYWLLAVVCIGGIRFVVRMFLESHYEIGEPVVIYGAGDAGARLAAALVGGREFSPVAFVDESVPLHGSVINGVRVFPPSRLQSLIENQGVKRVLLAIPSVSRRRRRHILTELESMPVYVQTMPNVSDLVSGKAKVDDIRDVEVEDLLGRDAVPPNEALLDACISGKNVMVTGAGGSIGSELCRQILKLSPKRLILYEISELGLYTIERELRAVAGSRGLGVEIVALLGSVHHRFRVREVMQAFSVETVYHAAAYKHVPIVEQNIVEGVYNNIFGTLNCAEAAIETGVQTFVLISTDKAVSPTNVMGATKRFSEMVLQGLNERQTETRFCMVRFGNVLASSGSVVPVFREQIRKGGPVTVTHPEIIRYFMTIPEAAQLVIQAGSMGTGGDVFVLDMGKPIRIEDLARRMVHLMGLQVRDDENPDGDIEIAYTGLRPAEKLYEELLIGNNVSGTEHPMIMRAEEDFSPWEKVKEYLNQLLVAAQSFDCDRVRELLLESVDGYHPTAEVADLVWAQRTQPVLPKKGSVTSLETKRSQT